MNYQKKVTYLYDNMGTGKSIGFAKWDVRNGMLRLQINIRTTCYERDGEALIFFGTEAGQEVELGSMKIADGVGEFRYMGLSDNIQNSGCSYEKITDVYVIKEGKKIIQGEFVEREPEKTGYEKLYAEKPRVDLFSDEDVYDCVEIEPDDIKNVPNTNWGLMNNSFLNHGFYAYRHLILGKQYKEDGFDYVIGVPGVYTRRDKNMANMFGFLHFKFSTRSDIRLSQFGYWYKTLEQ